MTSKSETVYNKSMKLPAKKQVLLHLPTNEDAHLVELAMRQGISKTEVIRRALRMYRTLYHAQVEGKKIVLIGGEETSGQQPEVILL